MHHQTALLLLPHINQQLSLLSPRPPRRPLQFRIDAMWQFLLASGCGIQLFRNEKCVLKKRPVTFYYSLFNLYFYICIYRVLLLSLSKFIPPASIKYSILKKNTIRVNSGCAMSSSIPHAAVVEQKVRLSHTPPIAGD